MWWRWPKNVILQFCCLVIPVLTWHPLPLEARLKRLSIFKPAQTNYFGSYIIVAMAHYLEVEMAPNLCKIFSLVSSKKPVTPET